MLQRPFLRLFLVAVVPASVVVLVLFLVSRGCASTPTLPPGFTKLTAPGDSVRSWFGESVAISGDTLVAGAPLDSGAARRAGAAYVFQRSTASDEWRFQVKLRAVGAAKNSKFGGAVAIEDDTVLVGAGQSNAWAGSAHVFARDGETWTELQKLTAPSGIRSVRFGRSLAISGDTCLVGGVVRRASWDTEGVVWVFVRARPGDRWRLQQQLSTPGVAGNLDFGHAVALSKDRALVGAPTDIDEIGKAWMFVREDGAWKVEQEMIAAGRSTDDFYGRSVALWGDTAIIGADNAKTRGPSSGMAFVFERIEGSWVERQTLLPDDLAPMDVFGYAIALHGDLAVLGATGRQPYGAYVFERRDGVFQEREKIVPQDDAAAFGHTVSLWGDTVVIGAYGDDDRGPASGSVLVRRLLSPPTPAGQ